MRYPCKALRWSVSIWCASHVSFDSRAAVNEIGAGASMIALTAARLSKLTWLAHQIETLHRSALHGYRISARHYPLRGHGGVLGSRQDSPRREGSSCDPGSGRGTAAVLPAPSGL